MTTALARLIKEAPDIAREVMPEGTQYDDECGLHHPLCDRLYTDPSCMPAWFYSAVAGKLAEWLASKRVLTAARGSDGKYWVCISGVTHTGPTFLDALVEAAIVVGREGK